jgi:iron complex transport system substrate-binding protein
MRVVSLLPSATELLCASGGAPLLVGRSHECDFPDSILDRPVLTSPRTCGLESAAIDLEVRESLARGESLYVLDEQLLRALSPDVILTQDLCEVCSIDLNTVRRAAAAMTPSPCVISLNPATFDDVLDDLLRVANAVGLATQGQAAAVALRARYWQARDHVPSFTDGPEIAFLEWMDPLFIGGHWTPGLIGDAGGRHSLNEAGMKSRRVSPEELVASRPEGIVICPCGYTLDRIRAEIDVLAGQSWWLDLPAVRRGRVALVDGNQMFNRPGPRLVEALEWLVGWIHDRNDIMPPRFPWARLREQDECGE